MSKFVKIDILAKIGMGIMEMYEHPVSTLY